MRELTRNEVHFISGGAEGDTSTTTNPLQLLWSILGFGLFVGAINGAGTGQNPLQMWISGLGLLFGRN